MPRKRKAARAFSRAPDTTVTAMRRRFADPFSLLLVCDRQVFFRELTTPAERATFAVAYPDEFWELFGFIGHADDAYPASIMHQWRDIFRRPFDEFMGLLKEHRPAPFAPPDVSALHYFPEQFEFLALARGHWWAANGLPMTAKEQRWLGQHDTTEQPGQVNLQEDSLPAIHLEGTR